MEKMHREKGWTSEGVVQRCRKAVLPAKAFEGVMYRVTFKYESKNPEDLAVTKLSFLEPAPQKGGGSVAMSFHIKFQESPAGDQPGYRVFSEEKTYLKIVPIRDLDDFEKAEKGEGNIKENRQDIVITLDEEVTIPRSTWVDIMFEIRGSKTCVMPDADLYNKSTHFINVGDHSGPPYRVDTLLGSHQLAEIYFTTSKEFYEGGYEEDPIPWAGLINWCPLL